MSDIKSQIVKTSVETDDMSHAKVHHYQSCDKPLIPSKNPSKQLDWTVELGIGSIYNPNIICGIYAKKTKIRYGARVNSSINSREEIIIENGMAKLGPTLVLGSITSGGTVFIEKPVTTRSDHNDGPAVIYGNIYANDVLIKGNANIYGNVIAHENVVIEGEAMIHGAIYSRKGKIKIEKTEAYSLIAGGDQKKKDADIWENDSPVFGIETCDDIILRYPMIWLKNMKDGIKINEPILIKLQGGKFPEKYNNIYLDQKDVISVNNGLFVSRNWRSLREEPKVFSSYNDNYLKKKIKAKNIDGLMKAFTKDEDEGFLTLNETGTKIIHQHIGDNIKISDSIINRSKIGGSHKTDSDDETDSEIDIDDSLVHRSSEDDDLFEKSKYRRSKIEISDSIVNRRKKIRK